VAVYGRTEIRSHYFSFRLEETKDKNLHTIKRYFPIVAALAFVTILAFVVISMKQSHQSSSSHFLNIGHFDKQRQCARLPLFLQTLHISNPVMIDLSQQRYKGVAFLFGSKLQRVIHRKGWEAYGYLGTYALDEKGTLYLTPMPYISIHRDTFALQTNIYRMDTRTGKLSKWMHLDDVKPSASNPYGIISIVYDCDTGTLWVSAIDQSDYQVQKGVIYHIDPVHKKVLETIGGIDALTLALLRTDQGRYLLVGSAREPALLAYPLDEPVKQDMKPQRVLKLPNPDERIRKIKVVGRNYLRLEAIPFSYSLVAQTDRVYRTYYDAFFDTNKTQWIIQRRK